MKSTLLAVGALCLVATSVNADNEFQSAQQRVSPGKVSVEMFVLHASTRGKGFDRRLPAQMKQRLERAPYSAYTRYMMLTRREANLEFTKPLLVNLPDRSVLRLTARPATGKRFNVKAEIKAKTSRKFLPVLQTRVRLNQLFFISGHRYNNGTLFVVVRLKGK